jgi:hypothetical protein
MEEENYTKINNLTLDLFQLAILVKFEKIQIVHVKQSFFFILREENFLAR